VPQDARLKSVIPDPAAAAADWHRRKGAIQVNHLVCVRNSMPLDVVDEVYRVLEESKDIGAKDAPTSPFGIEENRRNLEVAIDYVFRQGLIPRRFSVVELFE
jgi:4,5-dihydroxyphthalate decarboxylase